MDIQAIRRKVMSKLSTKFLPCILTQKKYTNEGITTKLITTEENIYGLIFKPSGSVDVKSTDDSGHMYRFYCCGTNVSKPTTISIGDVITLPNKSKYCVVSVSSDLALDGEPIMYVLNIERIHVQ